MQNFLQNKTASAAGWIVLIVGAATLFCWWLNQSPLLSFFPGWIVMKANTALCFSLIGLSLILQAENDSPILRKLPDLYRLIGKSCAWLVLMIGGLSLLQYLFGVDLGIDQFLAVEVPGAPATSHPGRMAPTTALCFVLASSALLLPNKGGREPTARVLSMASGLIGLLLLIGHLFNAELLPQYTRMALHTALLFVILTIGVFSLNRETGLAALFTSETTGGIMIRHLLPAIFCIPIVIGLMRLHAALPAWFGIREHVTVSTFFNIVLLGTLTWLTAEQLRKLDLKRQRTEKHLLKSLKEVNNLKTALDEHGIVAITNPSGKITYVNDKFCDISGYTREELIGQDHRIINSGHHSKEFIRNLWTTISSGKVWKGEIKNKAKNGTYYWVETTIVPFLDDQGKPLEYVAIRADITERMEAQEEILRLNAGLERRVAERTAELETANTELNHSRAELNSLFESLPGLYLVLTLEFKIVAVSDAYLKATLTTRESIIGKNLFEVFPDNPDEVGATGVSNLRASLNRVLETGLPDTMAIQKYDVRRPDGVFEERYWSPINSPVIGADHTIKYVVHRVEEVTDFMRHKSKSMSIPDLNAHLQQMEAEIFQSSQKLQTTNRQLEAANKELESFSYSVSHDLRAPLRAIAGFTQSLHKRYSSLLDESGINYLNRVIAAANRMSDLIDDLLHLSRVNRSDFKPQTVDLSSLVQEIAENLRLNDPERDVDLVIAPRVTAHGDPKLLRIALENILGNAWKFTARKTKGRIEFGRMQHPEKGPAIFVRDNGAGFDMAYVHKLFGPFQRLHAAHEYPGTGIGLAIVQRILNRHNGAIWPESVLEEGTTFYFTLPHNPTTKQS